MLTAHDLEWIAECWADEIAPALEDESYDGPTVIMLSSGYAELSRDSVVQNGEVVAEIDSDGDVTPLVDVEEGEE